MEQTPVQQLIQLMIKQKEYFNLCTLTYGIIMNEAVNLLAAEKERDKQIASLAWDAALNNWDWRYDNTNPEYPSKEEYLNSLVKKVEVKWEENTK